MAKLIISSSLDHLSFFKGSHDPKKECRYKKNRYENHSNEPKQKNGTTTSGKSKSPNSATKTTERGKKKTGVV